MPVTDVQHDLDTRTLTIIADFAAPVERVWQVYADPRQLEKVWGPPTYPATFVDHDLRPGGRVTYFMTSPEGDKHAGYWEVTAVDEPSELLLRRRLRRPGLQPEPGAAGLAERLHLRRARRRHARDLRRAPTPRPRPCSRSSTWASSRAPRRRSTRSTTSRLLSRGAS